MGDVDLDKLVEILLSCGDATRLRIINLLQNRAELTVSEITDTIGESQPKVSRHLSLLRRCGLVHFRRDGLWIYYRINGNVDFPGAELLQSLETIFGSIGQSRGDLQRIASLEPSAPQRFTQRIVRASRAALTTVGETPDTVPVFVEMPADDWDDDERDSSLEVELL